MNKTHSSPLVSVILPTYNRATMVTRAIESVLGQEFTDLELIVIDDGSTDETLQVISKIDDKRLRYIYFEKNRGNYVARNEGVRQARGEFIAHIDSDDRWLPQKISYQHYLFQKYKQLDLIFCNYIDLDDRMGTSSDNLTQNERAFQQLLVHELEGEVWEILGGLPEAILLSTFILQSTVMLRRSTFQSMGDFREDLRGGGDLEFYWRAALRGAKFAHTSHTLVERHVHGKNLTSDKLALYLRHLQVLQICDQTALDLGWNELCHLLQNAKFVTWSRIVFEHVYRLEFKDAISAYRNSTKYGSPFDILFYAGKVITRRGKERIRKLCRPTK